MTTRWSAAVVVASLVATGRAQPSRNAKVPNLVGKSLAEANQMMKAAGFLGEAEDHQIGCDDGAPNVDDGLIKCQDPAPGTVIDKHRLVLVNVVHGGHKKGFIVASQIRSLIDQPIAKVKDELKTMGFVGTFEMKPADDYHRLGICQDGTVCAIEPNDNVDVHGTLALYVVMPPPKQK
jgi:beta-lactam-binding protein with PASTA domain